MTGQSTAKANPPVLIYTIHRVEPWFAHLGRNMGFGRSVTVSDHRGDGDYNTIERFYPRYRAWMADAAGSDPAFDDTEIEDIVARCRLLRWLPARQARAMILAMADAFTEVLDRVRPGMIVSFPIDRYVSDVLARLGARRDIPFHEVTASAVPGMAMILHRGQLVEAPGEPDADMLARVIDEIASPVFTPSYVQNQKSFGFRKWFATFFYFQLRGWFFSGWKYLKRDPLCSHYMDASGSLGHKPRLADREVVRLVDHDWEQRLLAFPEHRRLFIGLQLFPEASIDYWVESRCLIDYEQVVLEVARAFSQAGFVIVVKDHPLQFGFRQRELIHRLKAISNVVFAPYEVSGNRILDQCGINFTLTGTLGMQAALAGKVSIVTPSYYTTPEDFVLLRSEEDILDLPDRVARQPACELDARRKRIVSKLLRGSFSGDFFSFRNFRQGTDNSAATRLSAALGDFLLRLPAKAEPR